MKNFTKTRAIIASLVVLTVIFFGFKADAPSDKISICHVPPGNPGNCHEITVSRNALKAHLDHGDRLVCHNEVEEKEYQAIADEYNTAQALPYQQAVVVRVY